MESSEHLFYIQQKQTQECILTSSGPVKCGGNWLTRLIGTPTRTGSEIHHHRRPSGRQRDEGIRRSLRSLRLPSRNYYWRICNWLPKTNFGTAMARDRINLIWRYLHLANNDEHRHHPHRQGHDGTHGPATCDITTVSFPCVAQFR